MPSPLPEHALPERLVSPPSGVLFELGLLRVELHALDRLGATHFEDDPEEFFRQYGAPPHPGREWWLRASCGLEFLLRQDFVTGYVTVGGDETAEFDHLVAHLPFESGYWSTWACLQQV